MTTKPAFFLFFVISASLAFGQNQTKSSVVANGGTTASNGSFRVTGTVGQPVIDTSPRQYQSLQSGFWAQAVDLITQIERLQQQTIPTRFALFQNYPNPFNPVTTIQFDIPEQTRVTITIYAVSGQKIDTLIDAVLSPGAYKLRFDAAQLATGVYFYRLQTNSFAETKKLLLIK